MFGTPLYLAEADVQYKNEGISFKALGCLVSLPKAATINEAYNSNTPTQMYGTYAELGYNLLQSSKSAKWSSKQLNVYARYELLDLNAAIPSNGTIDGTLQQSHLIAGFGYLPIPHVVIKADVRLLQTGAENPALTAPGTPAYQRNNTFLNLGIGYSF